MTAAEGLIHRQRKRLGTLVTWAQAREILGKSRDAILKRAWDEIERAMPEATLAEQRRAMDERGSVFHCAGLRVWVGRLSTHYTCRIKEIPSH